MVSEAYLEHLGVVDSRLTKARADVFAVLSPTDLFYLNSHVAVAYGAAAEVDPERDNDDVARVPVFELSHLLLRICMLVKETCLDFCSLLKPVLGNDNHFCD